LRSAGSFIDAPHQYARGKWTEKPFAVRSFKHHSATKTRGCSGACLLGRQRIPSTFPPDARAHLRPQGLEKRRPCQTLFLKKRNQPDRNCHVVTHILAHQKAIRTEKADWLLNFLTFLANTGQWRGPSTVMCAPRAK
jgi:hypothetical protein